MGSPLSVCLKSVGAGEDLPGQLGEQDSGPQGGHARAGTQPPGQHEGHHGEEEVEHQTGRAGEQISGARVRRVGAHGHPYPRYQVVEARRVLDHVERRPFGVGVQGRAQAHLQDAMDHVLFLAAQAQVVGARHAQPGDQGEGHDGRGREQQQPVKGDRGPVGWLHAVVGEVTAVRARP